MYMELSIPMLSHTFKWWKSFIEIKTFTNNLCFTTSDYSIRAERLELPVFPETTPLHPSCSSAEWQSLLPLTSASVSCWEFSIEHTGLALSATHTTYAHIISSVHNFTSALQVSYGFICNGPTGQTSFLLMQIFEVYCTEALSAVPPRASKEWGWTLTDINWYYIKTGQFRNACQSITKPDTENKHCSEFTVHHLHINKRPAFAAGRHQSLFRQSPALAHITAAMQCVPGFSTQQKTLMAS